MSQAFPLQWPAGRRRARNPQRSRFEVSFAAARDGILDEVRLLGGVGVVISTNVGLRRDGLPYAGAGEPADRGAAVYFILRGRPLAFACDRWDRVRDNLQAIRKTIEALRGIERWGSGAMVEQAFEGFAQLPPPPDPRAVLGVGPGAGPDEIDAAYRAKAKAAHPDNGGTAEAMRELIAARDTLRRQP